jgi:hypothetical protein
MPDGMIPDHIEPGRSPDGVVVQVWVDGVCIVEQHIHMLSDDGIVDMMAESAAELTDAERGRRLTLVGYDGDTGDRMMLAEMTGDA